MIEALEIFHWKSMVVLRTTSGSVTVHLRTLSSIQDEMRADGSLAASRIIQAQLEDETSLVYINHIAPLKELGPKGLKEIVRVLQRGLFVRESEWRVEPRGNPDPPQDFLVETDVVGRPSIEDVTKWKDTQDELKEELQKNRDNWVADRMKRFEKELDAMEIEQIQETAIDLHRLSIMDRAWNKEWNYQTIFHGSYKDKKCERHFWKGVQEVKELPRHIFQQMAAAYRELDEYSYNLEKLKNLS